MGIDVERRFPWKTSFARRVCHPLELERLLELEEAERSLWLNRIWSRKESYLKYLGIGIRRDLRTFRVWDGKLGEAGEQTAAGTMAPDGVICHFSELQTASWTLTAWGQEPITGPLSVLPGGGTGWE